VLNVHYLSNNDKIKIQTRNQHVGKTVILDKGECNRRQRGNICVCSQRSEYTQNK